MLIIPRYLGRAFAVLILVITVKVSANSIPGVSSPAVSSTGSYTVTWSGNPSTTRLEERVGSGNWSTVPSQYTETSGFSHITTLTRGNGTYYYRVYGCYYTYINNVLRPVCDYSATTSTQVKIPPQTPSVISITTDANNWRFTINWSSVNLSDKYELYQRVGSSCTGSNCWQRIYSGKNRTHSVPNVAPNTPYRFRVRACSNWSGCSSYRTSGERTIKFDGMTVYDYDELGRLISVEHPNERTTSYQYDDADNRTEKKVQQ